MLLGALAIGVAFGAVSRLTAFCFRSAVLEITAGKTGFQVRAWAVALATAVAATQALSMLGIVDLSSSIYLTTRITWLALAVGGLAFGIGMILARGCGARHMVLIAGGNLRSAIVLSVLGIVAYMTLRGILALPRTALESLGTADLAAYDMASQGLADVTGLGNTAPWIAVSVLALVALVLLLRTDALVRWKALATGAAVGLLIAAGWYVTGVIGFDEFAPVRTESLTFTAPVGNAIQFLMTYTGATADFGIVAVAGTVIGAMAVALVRGQWHLEAFETPKQLLRYVAGGALMGFGGVLALGCTVGAGLSGVSTLSLGSILAVVSIFIGAVIGDILVRREFSARHTQIQPAE